MAAQRVLINGYQSQPQLHIHIHNEMCYKLYV